MKTIMVSPMQYIPPPPCPVPAPLSSNLQKLQQAGGNVLLAQVPHEKTHGPMTIIKNMLEATTNVIKSRALENIVLLITHLQA